MWIAAAIHISGWIKTRKGVPELRGPACLSDIDKQSVYWSSSWARSQMSLTCITSTTIAGAGQHSFNTCLRCTWYRGCRLHTKFRLKVGPALQPIAGSMPVIVYDADPALIYHQVCCILCANMCHSTNTVSMLTRSLRRWPTIGKALGVCTVFSDCWFMLVTFKIPAPKTPDNTILWPNAGPALFQPKPLSS